jgi:uncharacterized damage-inducible protein DinB
MEDQLVGKSYAAMMARYNAWQNRSLERRAARGAFFGSIHATLNHILWADSVWLARFEGRAPPAHAMQQSTTLHDDFDALRAAREAQDAAILAWAEGADPAWFKGDLVWWSGLLNREMSKPKGQLVAHFFNHQTHHRGQVHAMLTAAGCKPEDTDLMLQRD